MGAQCKEPHGGLIQHPLSFCVGGAPFRELKLGSPWRDSALPRAICLSVRGGGFTKLSSQAVIELEVFRTFGDRFYLRFSEVNDKPGPSRSFSLSDQSL